MRPSMRMPSSAANRVSDARSPESCDLGLILLSCRHYLPVSSRCKASIPRGRLPIYYCRMKVCSKRQEGRGRCVKYEKLAASCTIHVFPAPYLQMPSWRRSSTTAVLVRRRQFAGGQETRARKQCSCSEFMRFNLQL